MKLKHVKFVFNLNLTGDDGVQDGHEPGERKALRPGTGSWNLGTVR